MRRDVRLLGEVLGEVISESAGADLLADVERLRHAVIGARTAADRGAPAGTDAGDEIAALVSSWSWERAELVARAFTVYFHLVNLSEEQQRVRALRLRGSGDRPPRESLADAVGQLTAERGAEHLGELLAGLRVHPVFTAHPTEARRRAVVASLRRVTGLITAIDDERAGALQQAENRRKLREEVDLLWRTAQLRVAGMAPADEVRTVMTAFDETLFRLVPVVYRALDHVLLGPDSGTVASPVPPFLRFGSWVGGDRDGNPNVTAAVTREAAVIQAEHALRGLEAVCGRIGRALTVDAVTSPPSPALSRALAAASTEHPELLAEISARSPGEPYRAWLLYAAERLAATRTRSLDLAYGRAEDFVADLRLVQAALAEAGAVRQAYGELQHLVWQAETFGFHLAGLEVRQHSRVHARALAELRAGDPPSAMTEEVLETIRVMGWIQRRYGVDACRRYIISFTTSAEDVAAVYELAGYAFPQGDGPVLDVVPLFETGEDLANAPGVLTGMLAVPGVAARLEQTGRHLEVMLGYSDSAKELGPASATLRLFDAQAELVAWAAEHDVKLTMFHGRGGAIGRGGGPAGRAVLAQAPGSVDTRLKVTEQGEVIFARYGRSAIGLRHLEQVTSAVLLASSPSAAERNAAAATAFTDVASAIDVASKGAFRALVESDGFAEWFAMVSPLEEIGGLRIGSRPSRRGHGGGPLGLEDLRAIPWVFAWAQTRLNLPGWYGLGSGLAAAAWAGIPAGDSDGDIPAEGLTVLRRAYREWPLLATLLDNAEMSLAKTDRSIASRYLALGGRPDLTERVLAEYDRTRRLVLAVTGHDRLVAGRPVLSRAIVLRDPYVDALSYLQLRALSALRADEVDPKERPALDRLLLLTVSGIAAGLQNTG
ncbi:phosphoenolpyruvate carboxylase [Trebonia kvetii]|uniref:Phosphoenolpyruvate carboxylase n=1 Tax=Trebonia kvetii TaxID=2480626 RepID=A0A6P2C7W1_9ACTN|nr:phosphoenolpyruvate carboxylase [Trebonia kvetii]TVZ07519.1 phosphoenolpyruvate carboxylase [Trebonia kvetii]